MMRTRLRPPRLRSLAVVLSTVLATLAATTLAGASPVQPNPLTGVAKLQMHSAAPGTAGTSAEEGDDPLEIADMAEEYATERTAPGDSVSAAALLAAQAHAANMPTINSSVSEVTNQPMDLEPNGYTDPFWSNAGAGFRDVSGRVTALAVDGARYYVGTADGGVWRSINGGSIWRPVWTALPTQSIGAVFVAPDHSVWVGTGEANTNSDSYHGVGVYRSTDFGTTWRRVGGDELFNRQVFRLVDDRAGHVYAATSQGLYRHADNTLSGSWQLVLKPDPNPTGSPYNTSFITDVAIKPGSHGL